MKVNVKEVQPQICTIFRTDVHFIYRRGAVKSHKEQADFLYGLEKAEQQYCKKKNVILSFEKNFYRHIVWNASFLSKTYNLYPFPPFHPLVYKRTGWTFASEAEHIRRSAGVADTGISLQQRRRRALKLSPSPFTL